MKQSTPAAYGIEGNCKRAADFGSFSLASVVYDGLVVFVTVQDDDTSEKVFYLRRR